MVKLYPGELDSSYVSQTATRDLNVDTLKYDVKTGIVWADISEYKDNAGKKGLNKKKHELSRLVKNIDKVLCSRGLKGCYVFCRNPELAAYLRERSR